MEILTLAGTVTRLTSSATQVEKVSKEIRKAPQSAQILEGKAATLRLSELPTLKALASIESTKATGTELPKLIILFSFLGIAQHLVGSGDIFEPLSGGFIHGICIWMILFGKVSIGLLDLGGARFLIHPENFVIVFMGHRIP